MLIREFLYVLENGLMLFQVGLSSPKDMSDLFLRSCLTNPSETKAIHPKVKEFRSCILENTLQFLEVGKI